MPYVRSLIRRYTSHDAYQQDATRLARLGYVVISVIEEPAQAPWVGLLHRLFGSISPRLTVTYSDAGIAPR
jgi:hypothetical protein